MKRVEFTKKVKLAMFLRAGGPEHLRCEGEECGKFLMGKPFEYDHTIEEWERDHIARGYREPLTAEEGRVLCKACHDAKTGKKAGERAHCNRLVEKAAKAKPRKSRPIPGSKASGWKKPLNKPAERR